MEFKGYFRRHEHSFAGGKVGDNFFVVFDGHESSESRHCHAVEVGGSLADYDGESVDKSVDVGFGARGYFGKSFFE